MKTDEIFANIDECIDYGDIEGFKEEIDKLLSAYDTMESSKYFSEFIYKRFTHYKGDFFAKLLEIVIRKKPELAQVNFPENFIFKLCLITGSKDLYDCFIEEAVLPHLESKNEDDHYEYFVELFAMAEPFIDFLFKDYPFCVKGADYNSAFATYENKENVVLINKEDYLILEDVVKKYNTLVGRKEILKDLNSRIEEM